MSKSPKQPKPKYRPVLTAEQITHILLLCKREIPITSASFSVIGSLAPFEAKIQAEAINPAYIQQPALSTLELLGGIEKELQPNGKTISASENPILYLTKEERWAQSYAKYRLSPESCTMQEIKDAQEHMYLNDLMSPEQLYAFEASLTDATDTDYK